MREQGQREQDLTALAQDRPGLAINIYKNDAAIADEF